MKVFLTGAAGFIGSHVARLLVREGQEVHALVRQSSDSWRIDDILPQLHLVRADLSDVEELGSQLRRIQPDLCIHLAWYAEPGKYLTSLENVTSLSATLRLASWLAELGCRRFIGTGTCAEYDSGLGYPSEESPTRPKSLYGATKLSAQITLQQLADVTGMEVAWCRLFFQYGPFEDKRRLVPSVVRSLLGCQAARTTRGEQIRDFLYVEDVAAAIWTVAQSDLSGPVNIGSARPVAVRDMITTIGAILGRPELIELGALPYGASEPMFICANNGRLTESTNWVPRYDLDEGLRHTVEWWRTHIGVTASATSSVRP